MKEKVNLENAVVINNGVDLSKFKPGGEDKTEHHSPARGEGRDEKIIVSVGILRPRKGYHISIPAVGKIAKNFSNLKYYIVGSQNDKNYFGKLKDLVKKHNLEKVVEFKQYISDQDLINLYQNADLFLLTPVNIEENFEGFGLVYLEANACGLPVVGSRGSGVDDAVIDGQTGILVAQEDIAQTAEVINKLLKDKETASKLGQAGLERAKEFSWQNIADKYLNIYNGS